MRNLPGIRKRTFSAFALGLFLALTPNLYAGYWRSDFNLDGTVDTNDLALLQANMGRRSAVPNPDVILTNVLVVTPDRKTILQGEATPMSAAGSTSAVYWTFIRNGSTATLTTNSLSTATHTAGLISSTVDVIQAWDAYNNIGRTYMNVIGSNEVAALGKAIIVAGGKSLTDPVWEATDYISDKAYNVLRYRGFSKANVNYVSYQPGQDVDNNGFDDDIDASSSFANVSQVFTGWVGNADKLFVYLADHGSDSSGQGFFRLNEADVLSATNLDAWLDDIQNTYTTEVTVVMDFCYSGSFLDELAYTGTAKRIIIASASGNELTYFIAGGLVSFSDVFWSGILQGLDLAQSFLLARDSMNSYQNSQMDDDGSGTYNPLVDGLMSTGRFVGATFVAGKDFPIIGVVLGNQLLTDSTTATLFADDISSYYPIDRVWCTIIPPSHDPNTNSGIPVVDVAEIDLPYNNTLGRNQSSFSGFTENGSYRVNYYAKDIWQSVSTPRQSLVIQAGYNEKMILIAGGPTNDPQWSAIRSIARTAHATAKTRSFTTNSIYFISAQTVYDADGDGTNDVNAPATLASLSFAFTNWAANAQRVTVYTVGGTTNGIFRLNGTQTVSAATLDGWLDQLQISNSAVNVFMEFPNAGSYIPSMVPPAGRERINVAGCKAGQPALWTSDGLVSFSQYLLSFIFQGETMGGAFKKAKTAIRLISGTQRQTAQMDDNGNGVPDEKNADGNVAQSRYLGPAFITGDDKPNIGSITPDQLINATTSQVLWAKDVVDVDGISNVWCIITPPNAAGTNDLIYRELGFNSLNSRYETTQTLDQAGTYAMTFYAKDNRGEVSPSKQGLMSSPDPYEIDDTAEQSSFVDGGDLQSGHNFHTSTDEDWVRFYAISGFVYQVDVEQQGTNVDVKLDLYWEQPDGVLTNIDPSLDIYGSGVGEVESTGVNLINNPVEGEGFYYLRVSSADTNLWGVGSDYDVSVVVPVGGGNVIVIAVDKLNPSNSPPGAVATVDGGMASNFNGRTSISYVNLPAGPHTVRVTVASGYLPSEDPVTPGQSANLNNSLYGNPKNKSIVDNGWQSLTFQFIPYVQEKGRVRDQWTGEFVAGAKIEFTATSGIISNIIYDGYPNSAAYESLWFTLPDGSFPTNVFLPTVNYNGKLSKAGYSNLIQVGSIISPTRGTTNDLGTYYLSPLDTNGNAIADSWETLYFGTNSFPAGSDSDADGQNNQNEYWSGTNPTNATSVFKANQANTTNGFTLVWPVSAGRNYRVSSTESLATGTWSLVAGPWAAAVGQTSMQWIDTNVTDLGKFYGIQLGTH